jgi:hypothetical protein
MAGGPVQADAADKSTTMRSDDDRGEAYRHSEPIVKAEKALVRAQHLLNVSGRSPRGESRAYAAVGNRPGSGPLSTIATSSAAQPDWSWWRAEPPPAVRGSPAYPRARARASRARACRRRAHRRLARRRLPQQVAAGLDAANQRSDDGGGDIRPVAPGALAADSKCL